MHSRLSLQTLVTLTLFTVLAGTGCGPKCEHGMVATDGYCCWPGQSWSKQREACAGKPQCPAGLSAKAGGCLGPEPECPEGMIGIGAASFYMGTDREGDDWVDSRPLRLTRLKPFCIDRTEVTVAAYKRCVEAGKCRSPLPNSPENEWVDPACNQLLDDRMQHPVNCVTWDDAQNYCAWADKRLPSGAEWELAGGRMDGREFPWGNEPPGPTRTNGLGTDGGRSTKVLYEGKDGFTYSAPVGSFAADKSPVGVLDMGGNVTEWTADQASGRPRVGHFTRGGSMGTADAIWSKTKFRIATPAEELGSDLGLRCAR